MDKYARIIGAVGLLVIGAGLVTLYFLGQLAFQFFHDPTQVPLLQYISSNLKLSGQEITGTMDGKEFAIKIPDPFLLISYLGLAILAAGTLIHLVASLITGGVQMVRASLVRRERSPEHAHAPVKRERKADNF